MSSSQGAQAAGPIRCRACGSGVAPGALRCGNCGAAQSDTTCPHCRATAGASLDAELRYVCDVCGGPRIPLGAGGVPRSGNENGPLKIADAARKSRAKWKAGAVASGVMMPMALLLCAVLAFWSVTTAVVLALFTAAPLAAALVFSLSKAKAKGREIQPALDAAWMAATSDVVAQSARALTPRDLAAALGIDEAKAEELLAMADVQASVGGGPPQRSSAMASFDDRLRVATSKATGAGAGAGTAEAELEAAAEAEASSEAALARKQGRDT